jgi:tRNA threonylcarbamoyl adenosine modification protein (Sua5/YciO/YrdC/YwlC family)
MLLEINPLTPEPRKIRRAVDALLEGGIVGYPTDTVYGLACDPANKRAIDRLYQIKGVDPSHQLAFVCKDIAQVAKYAVMHDSVYRTLKEFLPGPYTFILDETREVPRILQMPRKAVGVRVPNHPVALALAEEFGGPLYSSTATRHGKPAMPDPKEIELEFPGLSLVLDAGPGGIEPSSVVDLTGSAPKVLRAGIGDVSAFLDSD